MTVGRLHHQLQVLLAAAAEGVFQPDAHEILVVAVAGGFAHLPVAVHVHDPAQVVFLLPLHARAEAADLQGLVVAAGEGGVALAGQLGAQLERGLDRGSPRHRSQAAGLDRIQHRGVIVIGVGTAPKLQVQARLGRIVPGRATGEGEQIGVAIAQVHVAALEKADARLQQRLGAVVPARRDESLVVRVAVVDGRDQVRRAAVVIDLGMAQARLREGAAEPGIARRQLPALVLAVIQGAVDVLVVARAVGEDAEHRQRQPLRDAQAQLGRLVVARLQVAVGPGARHVGIELALVAVIEAPGEQPAGAPMQRRQHVAGLVVELPVIAVAGIGQRAAHVQPGVVGQQRHAQPQADRIDPDARAPDVGRRLRQARGIALVLVGTAQLHGVVGRPRRAHGLDAAHHQAGRGQLASDRDRASLGPAIQGKAGAGAQDHGAEPRRLRHCRQQSPRKRGSSTR